MVRKMVTLKKRLSIFIILFLSIFTFNSFALASAIPDATSQFYVNDFAGIISDEVEQEMQAKAVSLAESTDGIQVVVTTVKTIGNADPVDYTVDMYNKYGIGKNSMGVLIMLSVETRDIQIRIGDNMLKYLSDEKCEEILDQYGIPYFRDDKFETGLYEMQKVVIERISNKVLSLESEAVKTSVTNKPVPTQNAEPVVTKVPVTTKNAEKTTESNDNSNKNNGFWGILVGVLGLGSGGFLSFLGIETYLKKKKQKEAEMLENSELVQDLKVQVATLEDTLASERSEKESSIRNAEAFLQKVRSEAETTISAKNKEISSLSEALKSAQKELETLRERTKRAIIVHPDLEQEIDAVFAREKEEADKKRAFEVETYIREALKLECTRHNLYEFKKAYDVFRNLPANQQQYVPAEVVEKVKELYSTSVSLQQKFEEEERIRKDKEKAAYVQNLILGALTYSVTRHSLAKLIGVCNEYDNLTYEQQRYVTADIDSLYSMKREAKRLQDEFEEEELRRQREEEERRRREREEEERRRREREAEERRRREREAEERRRRQQEEARRRRAMQSRSSSSSHKGFGGRSSGHGAGKKF